MVYDLNEEAVGQDLANKRFDFCVAGAGVAGITLALKLASERKSVLLLEAGGGKITKESQDLYFGTSIGMEYLDLRYCRLRFLGGTSNHWGGWCRPLDPFDFEKKDYVEYSGWPIRKVDLDPYEEESYDILDIPDRPPPDEAFDHSQGLFDWFEFSYSPPTRFGDKYWRVLNDSEHVHLVLNANLTDLKLGDSLNRVSAVICRNYKSPTVNHSFEASNVILCLGGIENARVLLNADSQVPGGIGNESDLVGRFFLEHPHLEIGFYWQWRSHREARFLAPTKALQESAKIGNCGIRLVGYDYRPANPTGLEYVQSVSRDIACDMRLARDFFASIGQEIDCDHMGRLEVVSEQAPNPNSRILLSDERDKLGLRTVVVDWQWLPIDRRTVRVCAMELGKAFARGDLGRVKLEPWVLDDTLALPTHEEGSPLAGHHHMGTTRMADDPRDGVVDPNCRVFGVDNLFVAGSSVFTTVGHANPTFAIVQLTLRLADHLKNLA